MIHESTPTEDELRAMPDRLTHITMRRRRAFLLWRLTKSTRQWFLLLGWDRAYHNQILMGAPND